MENKILLILCDGMRPDALEQIQHPFYQQMKREGAYALDATTVMPSVTLPCHMSLFHSVDPSRHGVLTNTYVPQVRPIAGLCEQLRKFEKTCTMFYNWEELKDLTRPDSMMHTAYHSGHILGYEAACVESTRAAEAFIQKYQPDFTFLYLGLPDALGHGEGWMTQGYLDSLTYCWNCIEEICGTLPENYTVIVNGQPVEIHTGDWMYDSGEWFATDAFLKNVLNADVIWDGDENTLMIRVLPAELANAVD